MFRIIHKRQKTVLYFFEIYLIVTPKFVQANISDYICIILNASNSYIENCLYYYLHFRNSEII